MNINYDLEKLNTVLNDFSNVCGININIVDKEFAPLSKKWRRNNKYCYTIQSTTDGGYACYCSDQKLYEKCKASKKTEVHICHAGLVDVAVPIFFEDDVLGYIILGQMKKNVDFSSVAGYLINIPVDMKVMECLYEDLPFFDTERINSIANIATMISKYILLENILKPESNLIIERATDYIDKNLGKDLSIEQISKQLNVCRSSLYKNFENKFRCTPGEYIKKKRIEKSKELLLTSQLSIEDISEQVGFSSGAYFSHVFKDLVKVSPLKFRKAKEN